MSRSAAKDHEPESVFGYVSLKISSTQSLFVTLQPRKDLSEVSQNNLMLIAETNLQMHSIQVNEMHQIIDK